MEASSHQNSKHKHVKYAAAVMMAFVCTLARCHGLHRHLSVDWWQDERALLQICGCAQFNSQEAEARVPDRVVRWRWTLV
jgi:hypothetical protein